MFSGNFSQLSYKILRTHYSYLTRPFCTISAQMCFYEVLGIKSSASTTEIKKAYYTKVKKYHPDHNKNPSAEENFKIIAKAYETLKDPVSREQYDNTKNTIRQGSSRYSSDGFSNSKTYSSSSGFSTSGKSYSSSSYSNPHTEYSGRTYEHQEAWDHFNQRREEEQAKKRRRATASAENQNSSSIFESLAVRIGLIAALVYLFDYYLTDYKNRQRSVFQAESLAFAEPQKTINEREIKERKDISEEIKSKNFRIEYHTAPIVVSAEAAEVMKTYKKDKKIVGLDGWVEKQNFKLRKSEDRFAVN